MQIAHWALEKRSVSSPCLVGKGGDSVRVMRVQNNAQLKDASAVRLGCCAQAAAIRHGWRNRGEPGGTFPSGAPLIPFPGWDPGTQYITKMDPFYFSWTVFSNCNSCIGGFGPFDTLEDPFPRGPPRPSPPHLRNRFSSPAICQ